MNTQTKPNKLLDQIKRYWLNIISGLLVCIGGGLFISGWNMPKVNAKAVSENSAHIKLNTQSILNLEKISEQRFKDLIIHQDELRKGMAQRLDIIYDLQKRQMNQIDELKNLLINKD